MATQAVVTLPQCHLARGPNCPRWGELQCGQPSLPNETKLKQRIDNDDRYLILETIGTW